MKVGCLSLNWVTTSQGLCLKCVCWLELIGLAVKSRWDTFLRKLTCFITGNCSNITEISFILMKLISRFSPTLWNDKMIKPSFIEFQSRQLVSKLANLLTSDDMHSDFCNFSNGRMAGIVTRVGDTSLLDQQKWSCNVALLSDLADTSSWRAVWYGLKYKPFSWVQPSCYMRCFSR